MTLRMATPPLSGGSNQTMVDGMSKDIDTLSEAFDGKIVQIKTKLN